MFIEWRKIKGRYYAYARIAEWNTDRQRSVEEQIYLGSTPEKAAQKLRDLAKRWPYLQIDTMVLTQKLFGKYPGEINRSGTCVPQTN